MSISNRWLILGLACLWTTGVSAQDKPKTPLRTAARIQRKSYDFKEAGKEMEYALYVPSKYDKARKSPLMLALHGLSSNPQQIIRYPGLTDLAEKYGYIIAAPMGYNSSGWYGNRPPFLAKSNPENLCELSEQDVMNVLDICRKEFNVDSDRMYLMGHSMGGGGTLHLGIKYPKLWAGLAPIAPAIFRKPDELEEIKHVPIILVQGDKDKLVPIQKVRPWAEKMKELKMPHKYLEVAGGGHIDVIRQMPKIFEFFEEHHKVAEK